MGYITADNANYIELGIPNDGSVVVGDLLVIGANMASGSREFAISGGAGGWTTVPKTSVSGHMSQIWYKKAQAGDLGAVIRLTPSVAVIKMTMVMMDITGGDPGTPIFGITSMSTLTAATTKVTPTVDACPTGTVEIGLVWDSRGGTTPQTTSWTAPAGFTRKAQYFTTAASGSNSGAYGVANSVASGTLGNRTWTADQSALGSAWTIAIQPPIPTPPSGPTWTYWNGTTELTLAVKYWTGTAEVDPSSTEVYSLADGGDHMAFIPKIYRPEDYKQTGDSDWTNAFKAMFADIQGHMRVDAGGGVQVVDGYIELTAQSYTISDTIMASTNTARAQGLTIRGNGKRTSEIVTSSANPIINNIDKWMGVTFYDVSFRSTNAAGKFMYSSSTGANQDFGFTRCEWRGSWTYGIGLDGPEASNTNSEFWFDRCHVNGSYTTAFFWSGMSPQYPQQDQFLNYSFRDCKIEYDWGDFLRFDKGGSINIQGGSYIIKGQRPDNTVSRYFYMPPSSHYDSVQNIIIKGVRFELRNAYAQCMDSAWKGNVAIEDCMDDALGYQSHSPNLIAWKFTNPGGVFFKGCSLVGKHQYTQSEAPSRQKIVYMMNQRKNNTTASTFLVKDGASSGSLDISHLFDKNGIS
ncbi:hypothetical protein ACWIG4_30415 [Streptomyces sp. NPDC002248]